MNCIICQDSSEFCKFCITKCGHVFHSDCLMNWFYELISRDPNCPICRKPIDTENDMKTIYLDEYYKNMEELSYLFAKLRIE